MRLLIASSCIVGAVLWGAVSALAQSVDGGAGAGGAPTVVMPATTRSQAHEQAKSESGRTDPLAPVTGFKHFPSHDASFVAPGKVAEQTKLTPVKSEASGKGTLSTTNPFLKIPPPPPDVSVYPAGSSSENELPVSELPEPPERPSILNSIKLTGIVGDKAIFSVTDAEARARNRWPKALSLAAGDKFEGISVISVGPSGAVLEESGSRVDLRLERIR